MSDRSAKEGKKRDVLHRDSGGALGRVVGHGVAQDSITASDRRGAETSSIPARLSTMRLLGGMVQRILRVPTVISSDGTAVPVEKAVVFTVGALDVCAFGSGFGTDSPASTVELSFTLNVNGYRAQSARTSTLGTVREMPSMLQQGFTFSFDQTALKSAVLTVKVIHSSRNQDRQVVAEHVIPVQNLLKGSREFFHETISFAVALQDRSENCNEVPEVAAEKQAVAVRGPVRTLKDLGRKFCHATISLGMFRGLIKRSTQVPTVKLAFEILSVGDGKMRMPNEMHFMHLELAQGAPVVFFS